MSIICREVLDLLKYIFFYFGRENIWKFSPSSLNINKREIISENYKKTMIP